MSTQFTLPDIGAVPEPTDRLFFAVLPDTAAAERITQLARHLRGEHGLQGRPLEVERLHLSLQGLGDHVGMPSQLVECASQAAAKVALPSFSASFDRVLSFAGKSHRPGSRALVMTSSEGLAGLQMLYKTLTVALQTAGALRRAAASFTPHVTLLYDRQRVAERTIEPVGWTVREFVLVHSLVGQNRPYTLLGRWPLRD